ncbi:MAG TPA: cytochrome P450 [Chloroflexota bacterium]|nr:cytochrome P450 [Chloroflexota bacterium]
MNVVPPAEYRRDPYPFYAMMRRDHPVAYDERTGFWAVYRYDDVRHVITDHDTFSSDRTRLLTGADPQMIEQIRVGSSLVGTDPPRHRLLRDLVSRAFTPRAIAQLEPHIAELTEAMLDAVIPAGHMDLIADLAYPLPVTVIAEMLGVPASDRPTFKAWADALVSGTNEIPTDANSPLVRERMQLLQEMNNYFRDVVDQRRATPKDDLVSRLVAAEVEGQRLSEGEVLAFCTVLLVAGHITTTNLLGNAVLALLDHPDQLARLQADLTLVPSAVEEALRYDGPVQAIARFVARDTEIGGQHLKAGQRILAWTAAANRDAAVFAAPDRFDVTRTPNPHLAFGAGIHFCLGAPLARLESRVALTILLRRLQAIELAERAAPELTDNTFLRGVTRLPLRFQARAAA